MVRLNKEMKGGSKVKTKKGEDETNVRAEMLALQEEEERRRKDEAARVRLRQKQLNEQRYAYINGIKIHNQWRKIQRLAKVEDLRKEIEILSQNHEREVDRKDAMIQMLDRDLEDAEEQYQMSLRSHLSIVDSLIDLQYSRVKALNEEFTNVQYALENEFDNERTEIQNAHFRNKKDLLDMMTAMEAEFAEADADARQEFESQREEIKNRNSEEYNVLKISLETSIEELERNFDQAHVSYINSTEQRTQQFRALTKKDKQKAHDIEVSMRQHVRLTESLAHWRTKISSNSREWEERNRSLRQEKDTMSKHYQQLKGGMNRFRDSESSRLKELSINSGTCLQRLQNKLDKAEKILRLAELNRKVQTEQEKIAPFKDPEQPLDGATPEQDKNQKPRAHSQRSTWGSDAEAVVEEWHYLDRFFERHNKVLMDKMSIDREKLRLEKENSDLRTILKQYLDGISVNEDVLNNLQNPLLVVNNRLQLSANSRAKQVLQHVLA